MNNKSKRGIKMTENDELKTEIERLLTDYVNKNNMKDVDIIIDHLWRHKTVKIIPHQ